MRDLCDEADVRVTADLLGRSAILFNNQHPLGRPYYHVISYGNARSYHEQLWGGINHVDAFGLIKKQQSYEQTAKGFEGVPHAGIATTIIELMLYIIVRRPPIRGFRVGGAPVLPWSHLEAVPCRDDSNLREWETVPQNQFASVALLAAHAASSVEHFTEALENRIGFGGRRQQNLSEPDGMHFHVFLARFYVLERVHKIISMDRK